jgi:hypothetical protein
MISWAVSAVSGDAGDGCEGCQRLCVRVGEVECRNEPMRGRLGLQVDRDSSTASEMRRDESHERDTFYCKCRVCNSIDPHSISKPHRKPNRPRNRLFLWLEQPITCSTFCNSISFGYSVSRDPCVDAKLQLVSYR